MDIYRNLRLVNVIAILLMVANERWNFLAYGFESDENRIRYQEIVGNSCKKMWAFEFR